MEIEIWKDIEGFEGLYQISNLGKVRNSDRDLRLNTSKDGYKLTYLYTNKVKLTRTVHRLVAKAFIPNLKNKPCVNHINGIKTDNRIENLEWVTYSENTLHSFRTGLQEIKYGSKHHSTKIPESEYLEIFKLNNEGKSSIQISKLYSVSKFTIQRILNNRRRGSKGLSDNLIYIKRNAKQKTITEDIIKAVKIDLENGLTYKDIAKKHKMSTSSISWIKNGKGQFSNLNT